MTDLTGACADLERWLPVLADALQRDNTPSGRSSSVTAASVCNMDVLQTMVTLKSQVPEVCATAAYLTGETWRERAFDALMFRSLPRFAVRLVHLQLPNEARHVELRVGYWTSITKFALGLRKADQPIGYDCPLHDEPSPLVAVGAEATITDRMNVVWQQGGLISCHQCGAEWPATQWLHLGRILEAS